MTLELEPGQVWRGKGNRGEDTLIYVLINAVLEDAILYSILMRIGEWHTGGSSSPQQFGASFPIRIDQKEIDEVIDARRWFKSYLRGEDDPADHPIDCTCIFCLPGA